MRLNDRKAILTIPLVMLILGTGTICFGTTDGAGAAFSGTQKAAVVNKVEPTEQPKSSLQVTPWYDGFIRIYSSFGGSQLGFAMGIRVGSRPSSR